METGPLQAFWKTASHTRAAPLQRELKAGRRGPFERQKASVRFRPEQLVERSADGFSKSAFFIRVGQI